MAARRSSAWPPGSVSSRASTSGKPEPPGKRGHRPRARLMDEAEIPHAIEVLVGLLGLAAFVAIVARPLRLPYTVALVVAGLVVGIVAGAAGVPKLYVAPAAES